MKQIDEPILLWDSVYCNPLLLQLEILIKNKKAEFKGHAAVTDSVVVQTATETGSMVVEAAAWLWVS